MDPQDRQEIIENISYLIQASDEMSLKTIVIDTHPADVATILSELEEEERNYLFSLMETVTASDVMIELDEVTREQLVNSIEPERLSEIVDEMDSDDAADVVQELDEDDRKIVLSHIEPQDRFEVETLLRHDEESAGGIMALEYIAVYEDETVDDAIQKIRTRAQEIDEIFYVYATDRGGRLTGVVPIKSLFLRNPRKAIGDIMQTDVISVNVGMDQEEVAHVVRKYDLPAVPVIDRHGRLVGRITFDDIVDVLQEEATEDIQKMAGISDEEILQEMSAFKISRTRMPWLVIAFVGQLVAALTLSQFEATLHQVAVLTFFIPLIMAMGGNSGIQSSTVVIRSIALGDSFSQSGKASMFWRELRVGILNGLLLGLAITFFYFLWRNDFMLGLTIGVSLICVIVNSAMFGVIIPSTLNRLKFDPAIATGPFITTINDILGIIIYLSLARLYIAYFS